MNNLCLFLQLLSFWLNQIMSSKKNNREYEYPHQRVQEVMAGTNHI